MANFSVEITLRHEELSPQAEDIIRQRIDKLGKYDQNIQFCQVIVDSPQQRQKNGKLYQISIKLGVPGTELIANHNEEVNFQTALSQAFDDIKRQLENHQAKLRDYHRIEEKTVILGHVVRLFETEGYGFIEDESGAEYYFNKNQLVNLKFDELQLKQLIRFVAHQSDQGLQAHHITPCKEHGSS